MSFIDLQNKRKHVLIACLSIGMCIYASCGPSSEPKSLGPQGADNKSLKNANCPPGVTETYTALHEQDKALAKKLKDNRLADRDTNLDNLQKIKDFRKQVEQYGKKYPHITCYGLNKNGTLVLIDVDKIVKGSLVEVDKAIDILESLI